MVNDALSRKFESTSSLAYLEVTRHQLASEFQTLDSSLMTLELSHYDRVLAHVEVRSSFLDQVKTIQFDVAKLRKICDKVLQGKAKEAMIDDEGVLRNKWHMFDQDYSD